MGSRHGHEKGLPTGIPSIQGAPGSSDGRAEMFFSNRPPLPMSLPAYPWPPNTAKDGGPSSWAAPPAQSTVPWGSSWVWEGLFHQHPPVLWEQS